MIIRICAIIMLSQITGASAVVVGIAEDSFVTVMSMMIMWVTVAFTILIAISIIEQWSKHAERAEATDRSPEEIRFVSEGRHRPF